MSPLPDPGKPFAHQAPIVLLAQMVWGESRGEVFQGKLGVAHVACNRLKAGHFGTDLQSVCLKPFQFSCFNLLDPNRAKLSDPLKHAPRDAWEDCYFAAYLAFAEYAIDPSLSAIFYIDSSLSNPPKDWGSVVKTVTIGRISFYRPVVDGPKPDVKAA